MADIITIIDETGTERRLGNIEPPAGKLSASWPVFGDVPDTPLLPRDQWQPIDLTQWMPPIKDQNGRNACNAFDTANVLEACRAQQGLPYVKTSPGDLYARINGGQDEGSMLEDAISEMMKNGIATAATVPELEWRLNRIPAAAKAERPNYKILEAWLCPDFAAVASALQAGFIVSVGIPWGKNDRLDGDGWLPDRPQGRQGGHAICACALANRAGKWGAKFANTWTAIWGLQGFGYIPEARFGHQVGGFWACRSTVQEGGVIPAPVE